MLAILMRMCTVFSFSLVSVSLFILLISSPEPKALRRAYSIAMLRRLSVVSLSVVGSNILFSETAWPIKAKFCVDPPCLVNRNLFTVSGSHDQDGHHAHIW